MLSIDSVLPTKLLNKSNSSLKFILYLKNKEADEMNKVLKHVQSLSDKEQAAWKTEYGEIIDYALDLFVDDSNSVLEKIQLDEEVLELSSKLVLSLQDAVKSAETILGSEEELQG